MRARSGVRTKIPSAPQNPSAPFGRPRGALRIKVGETEKVNGRPFTSSVSPTLILRAPQGRPNGALEFCGALGILVRTPDRARSLPRARISPRTRFRAHKFPRARAPGGLPAAAATMKSIPGSPPKGENFFHNYEINMKSIPALTEDAPAAPNGPPNAPPKGRRNPVSQN